MDTVKVKTLVGLEPTKILGREAMLWRVTLVTMYRPKGGGAKVGELGAGQGQLVW